MSIVTIHKDEKQASNRLNNSNFTINRSTNINKPLINKAMRNITATGKVYGEEIAVKQINKTIARKLYESGKTIYLQTSNFYPFGVWQNLMNVCKSDQVDSNFDYLCDSFRWYNCDNERGKYIHFYCDVNN